MNDVMALVLNYNTYELTKKCVESLIQLLCGIEILIVDNCSTDGSLSNLRYCFKDFDFVHIIGSDSNLGYACGNNLGMRYISANYRDVKYVLVMNPDVIVEDPKTIIEMRRFLEKNDDFAIVTTRIILNETNQNLSNSAWKFPSVLNMYFSGTIIGRIGNNRINDVYPNLPTNYKDTFMQVDIVSGCFFMAKLDCLKKISYFDSRTFLYWEETILSCKLRKIGKKEAVILNCVAFHNHIKKDKTNVDNKKLYMYKKYFYRSKMVFINNYSGLKGPSGIFCNIINFIDYNIKSIYYGALMLFARE